MAKVLEGIRVIDATIALSGPYCGQMLADFGAEVIRLEPPGGALDRHYGAEAPGGGRITFPMCNRNKKGITLNMKHPRGKELLLKLVKSSDVFLANMTGPTLKQLGIGYDVLGKVNPQLIYAAITGYGREGPYAHLPSFDPICQAITGHMTTTGFPDSPPLKPMSSFVDYGGGMYCAIGILLALFERQKTGKGQEVDVALLDTSVSFMESVYAMYTVLNEVQPQLGNSRPFSAPTGAFRCKDGYVYISVTYDSMWKTFTKLIGREELGNDPHYGSTELRRKSRDFVHGVAQDWLKNYTRAEAVKILYDAGIPAGPVNTVPEAIKDPIIAAREAIVDSEQPGIGHYPLANIVVKLSETPGKIEAPAPIVGQHNREVYRDILGLNDSDLDKLKREGII